MIRRQSQMKWNHNSKIYHMFQDFGETVADQPATYNFNEFLILPLKQ